MYKKQKLSTQNLTMDICNEIREVKTLILQQQRDDTERFRKLVDIIELQNKVISGILGEQTAHIKSLVTKSNAAVSKFFQKFPITSDEGLKEMENAINEENEDELIAVIKHVLGSKGLIKGITSIISQKLLIEYNYFGIHNKKSLRDYKKFMGVLRCAANEGGDFERTIRKAIKNAKNRHFKDASVLKQKQKTT
ncbi:uncharacterized protein [Musca autumnalis]|uniref:uncharacterized protein n=1 Tax=Musca autumnalis TaxID=221902 RepID=UPI003CEDE4EC